MNTNRALVALLLLLSMWLFAAPAEAVTCSPLEPGLPGFELVVRGKIAAIPRPGEIELSVSRYFKGSGPVLLRAEVSGIGQGQRMDWTAQPRPGDEVVAAFRREDAVLRNTICNPFAILKPGEDSPNWVTAQFGEGVPPNPPGTLSEQPFPEPDASRPLPRALIIGGASVAVLLALAVVGLRSRSLRR